MRSLKAGLATLALVAGNVFASPVVWTIPTTALSAGYSISGNFTWDTATNTASDVNISVTGTGSYTMLFPGFSNSGVMTAQQSASIPNGDKGVYITLSGIPSAGGSFTTSSAYLLNCTTSGGLCNGGGVVASVNSLSITGQPVVTTPATVPTLSEYAMIALASLMAMGGIWTMRKRGKI